MRLVRLGWWLGAALALLGCRDLEALVLGAGGGWGGAAAISGSSGQSSGERAGQAGVGGQGGSSGPGSAAGGAGSGSGGVAGTREPSLVLDPCPLSFPIHIGPLPWREGLPDRVWGGCLGGTGSLYEMRPDGTALLRLTVKLAPRPSQGGQLGEALSADLDADGMNDLLVGYSLDGEAGLLWSQALPEGKFAPLRRLIALNSQHFAAANLDDKPGVEIVGVEDLAPKQEPGRGRLVVYQQQKEARWQLVSSTPIAGAPAAVYLKDLDGDGSLDAVVEHRVGYTEMKVYPGRGMTFGAASPNLHPPTPSHHDPWKADLDGDGVRDDEIFVTDLPSADGKLPISPRGLAVRRRRPLRGAVTEGAQTLLYPPTAGR